MPWYVSKHPQSSHVFGGYTLLKTVSLLGCAIPEVFRNDFPTDHKTIITHSYSSYVGHI